MIPEAIHTLIRNASAESAASALEDSSASFWVDWREDDDQIPGLCERVLRTGHLSSDWDDDTLLIVWRGQRFPVPRTRSLVRSLAASPLVGFFASVLPVPVMEPLSWLSRGDRHTTLFTLDQALHPDYEIRYVCGSMQGGTAAFVPLAASDWADLEQQYGHAAVEAVVASIREHPNLYTEKVGVADAADLPWWQFW